MIRFIAFLLILGAVFLGYWIGKPAVIEKEEITLIAGVHPEKEAPLVEHKSFAVVIYAHNAALWCERSLRSVFEQEYDYHRVIFVDDGSSDGTFEKATQFVIENQQEHRVILFRNEERLGLAAALYRAVDNLLDREIVVPLDGKDWLAHPMVLTKLNLAYQNPDLWIHFGGTITYPQYEKHEAPLFSADEIRKKGYDSFDLKGPCSFYSALFKQIRLPDLYKKGQFADRREAYLIPMLELAGGRVGHSNEPMSFSNQASPVKEGSFLPNHSIYSACSAFPHPKEFKGKTDIVLFSYNRPLQLYACLESIVRYLSGYEKISVLYRSNNASFAAAYEKVKLAFPTVHFVDQSVDPHHSFKPLFLKMVFDSPSEFILFGVDDIIVKDFADLKVCMQLMEKTGAYGFYLRFGKHITYCYQSGKKQAIPPSIPVASGVYAWDLDTGEFDWGFPNSVDLTLFRKSDLKEPFTQMKYKTPKSLEYVWAKRAPKVTIGLYFEQSKMVNLPLNIVGKGGNPHMSFLTVEEMLEKFNQGLKIHIEPLYKVENSSPHFEYIPEFIERN